MRASLLLIGVLLYTSGVGVPAHAQSEEPTATVHLRLIDSLGEDISQPEVAVFQDEFSGRNLAGRFHDGNARKIPFGVYYMRAHATGFASGNRVVAVYQGDVWVLMGLEAGNIADPGPLPKRVSGSLRNIRSFEGVWVRLAGVCTGVLMDAKPDRAGDFTITGVPDGRYILLTSQNGRVLDLRELMVSGKSVELTVDLNSAKTAPSVY